MADLIDRQAALEEIAQITDDRKMNGVTVAVAIQKLPAVDAVPRAVLEQIRWERDIAIEQLKSYGVSLGEKADCVKVTRCKDCKRSGMYAFGCGDTETLACLDVEEDGLIRFATAVDPNGFCNYGERREDDGTAQI